MTVQLYAFTCGHLTLPMSVMLAGADGFLTVPIPAYLIIHPRGRVLFDTGLNPAVRTDRTGYLGEMAAAAATFQFSADEEIASRLASMNIAADGIELVVNSHLHLDHAGGNAELPTAGVIVQRRELESERAKLGAEYISADFNTGQELIPIDGEYDVFGDGTVACFPTYGHTAGHQSLRVKTIARQYVLCADACYLRKSLDELHLPGLVFDEAAALQSLHRLREMRQAGAHILYGHDPAAWALLPQAPAPLGGVASAR